jgi:hypothetical protein
MPTTHHVIATMACILPDQPPYTHPHLRFTRGLLLTPLKHNHVAALGD